MEVPFFDIGPMHGELTQALHQAAHRVIDSGTYILGPEVEAFENELAGYARVNHAIGVSSGSDALVLALLALDIKPGDEVITTPFTFFATAGAIVRAGATPRFVDIEPDSFTIDPAGIAAALSDKSGDPRNIRAIMPVHLYGKMASMDAILNVAGGIPVVEDLAQALGAIDANGNRAGRCGLSGCVSFFPSKNIGGFGDGGAVLTNDGDLAALVRSLRVHGSRQKYVNDRVGLNARLDALQASLLRVKLPHLDSWIEMRRLAADRYDRFIEASGLTGMVKVPHRQAGERHSFNQYVIRVPDRNRVKAALESRGVNTMVYYPVPLHLQPCFKHLNLEEGDFPVAEAACREVLALPVYPGISEDAQRYVVQSLAEALDRDSSTGNCTAQQELHSPSVT